MQGYSHIVSNQQVLRPVSGMLGYSLSFENLLIYQVRSEGNPIGDVSVLIKDNEGVIDDKNIESNANGYFFSSTTYTGDITITLSKPGYHDEELVINTQTAIYPYAINLTRVVTSVYGHIKIPIVNGLKLVVQNEQSIDKNDFSNLLQEEELCLPFVRHPYYWPIQTPDNTVVQIESAYETNALEIVSLKDNSITATINQELKQEFDGYNTYEFNIDWSLIQPGYYYAQIKGVDVNYVPYLAKSEPIYLSANHPKSVLLTWYNNENAHGINYRTGIEFSIRIPGYLRRTKLGGSRDVSIDSANRQVVVEEEVYRLLNLYTDFLPDYLHEMITILITSDVIQVNGIRYTKDKAYEWSQSLGSSLSKGTLTLRQYDFNYQNTHDANTRQLNE